MSRQDRVHDLRHHGIVIPDDTGEYGCILAKPRDQVFAQFVFDRPKHAIRRSDWRPPQGAKCARKFSHGRSLVCVVRRRRTDAGLTLEPTFGNRRRAGWSVCRSRLQNGRLPMSEPIVNLGLGASHQLDSQPRALRLLAPATPTTVGAGMPALPRRIRRRLTRPPRRNLTARIESGRDDVAPFCFSAFEWERFNPSRDPLIRPHG